MILNVANVPNTNALRLNQNKNVNFKGWQPWNEKKLKQDNNAFETVLNAITKDKGDFTHHENIQNLANTLTDYKDARHIDKLIDGLQGFVNQLIPLMKAKSDDTFRKECFDYLVKDLKRTNNYREITCKYDNKPGKEKDYDITVNPDRTIKLEFLDEKSGEKKALTLSRNNISSEDFREHLLPIVSFLQQLDLAIEYHRYHG